MRSEKSRSTLSRPVATAMIFLASGLACSLAMAEPAAQAGQLESVQVKGRAVQSVQIDNLEAATSKGTVISANGVVTAYFFNKDVVVQATDWSAVQAVIGGMPGVTFGRALGNRGRFHVIETPSVGVAFEVQKALSGIDGVMSVQVDSGPTKSGRQGELMNTMIASRAIAASNAAYMNAKANIGVIPVDSGSDPASIPLSQWHFSNTAGGPGSHANPTRSHDNNILESIYSTDMLTGTGVVVGLSSIAYNVHLDVNHIELVSPTRDGGYREDLSQPFDPNLTLDDDPITGFAGIIAAERTEPPVANDLQGVSPGAGVATMFRGPTPLFESQAYEWNWNEIDIKVHEISGEYDVPGAMYNRNRQNEYVSDSFKNSIRFGRGRLGTIHIFGTGVGFNLLPDPYRDYTDGGTGPTSQLWDVIGLNPNKVGVSQSNRYLTQTEGAAGPLPDFATTPLFRNFFLPHIEQFYVGGQTHQFPLANDRTSLIIQTVSEDGNSNSLGAIGPGVFASFFAGSSNDLFSFDQSISGRGIMTISGEGDPDNPLPAEPGPGFLASAQGFSGDMTGASVAAGVIALMLEANPGLRIRDIQHIFFESIQESTKISAVKWPNFESQRNYYGFFADPRADIGASLNASFWQLNTAFYNNPDAVPPVVNQTIRHSDQYGFGVVDANLAIQKARTWTGLPQLVLLDSGIVGDINDDQQTPNPDDLRVPFEIEDAEWDVIIDAEEEAGDPDPTPTDGVSIDGSAGMIFFTGAGFSICIRQNILIESIVLELTIEGEGSNDLYIELQSPTGTRSTLALPTTLNPTGMSPETDAVDPPDEGFNSGRYNDTDYAYYQHPFLTHKYWGELSGGRWQVRFVDLGPDIINPEGVEPGPASVVNPAIFPNPGADMIIDLGEIGIPGDATRSGKTVVAFRLKVYGTEIGVQPFLGCPPGETSCPGDLNGDGRIDLTDLHLFLAWYTAGDARADLTGDGNIDFSDIQAYLGLFQPGFCTTGDSPFTGGRPIPGGQTPSDNNPPTRPI
ncbi:MAG: proprotein convertase P-domain-containing protein [Phycisphaerales bacterium]|nr:proprotein convertase P-domain-containing protein [Phycisphaerales bacterium]